MSQWVEHTLGRKAAITDVGAVLQQVRLMLDTYVVALLRLSAVPQAKRGPTSCTLLSQFAAHRLSAYDPGAFFSVRARCFCAVVADIRLSPGCVR